MTQPAQTVPAAPVPAPAPASAPNVAPVWAPLPMPPGIDVTGPPTGRYLFYTSTAFPTNLVRVDPKALTADVWTPVSGWTRWDYWEIQGDLTSPQFYRISEDHAALRINGQGGALSDVNAPAVVPPPPAPSAPAGAPLPADEED